MNKLFTIIFLFVSVQLFASEKHDDASSKAIATVGSVKVSPDFVKPDMAVLNKGVKGSVPARSVVQMPSLRKQSKRYRPASAPGLQKKINWVFAY